MIRKSKKRNFEQFDPTLYLLLDFKHDFKKTK